MVAEAEAVSEALPMYITYRKLITSTASCDARAAGIGVAVTTSAENWDARAFTGLVAVSTSALSWLVRTMSAMVMS